MKDLSVQIPVDEIYIDGSNQRENFDVEKIKELAASIKKLGLIQSIVVCEIENSEMKKDFKPVEGKKYLLIAGERRLKAYLLNKEPLIEAKIRNVNISERLEIQISENLQREDIHELEEAKGFQAMMDSGKYKSPQDVAERVGKSHTYVYGRLYLLKLIPIAKELFFKGYLSYSHAKLLSRINEEKQLQAIIFCCYNNSSSRYEKKELEEVPDDVPTLRNWIQNNSDVELKLAPFKLDAKFPILNNVPTCLECPKNAKNNNVLFDEYNEKSICTDSSCFNLKKQTYWTEKLEALKKKNPNAVLGSGGYGTSRKDFIYVGYDWHFNFVKSTVKGAIPVLITEASGKYKLGDIVYIKHKPKPKNNSTTSSAKPKTPQQIEKEKEAIKLIEISKESVMQTKVSFVPVLLKKIKWNELPIVKLFSILFLDFVDRNMDFLETETIEKYGEALGIDVSAADDFEGYMKKELKACGNDKNKLTEKLIKFLVIHNLDTSDKLDKKYKDDINDSEMPYDLDFSVFFADMYGMSKELETECKKTEKQLLDEYKKKKADELKPKTEAPAEPSKKNIAAIPNKSKKSKKK